MAYQDKTFYHKEKQSKDYCIPLMNQNYKSQSTRLAFQQQILASNPWMIVILQVLWCQDWSSVSGCMTLCPTQRELQASVTYSLQTYSLPTHKSTRKVLSKRIRCLAGSQKQRQEWIFQHHLPYCLPSRVKAPNKNVFKFYMSKLKEKTNIVYLMSMLLLQIALILLTYLMLKSSS